MSRRELTAPPVPSVPPARPTLDAAYAAHADCVFGLAHRLLGDRMLAEEITQEVFLRFWRNPLRFDPERGSVRTFLLTDCHGRAVDAIRAEEARRRREDREGARVRTVRDVAGDVCDSELEHQVGRLVDALPEAEREAIALAYRTELSYREVAAVLDTPEGTVKGRIRSGLRRMRAELIQAGIHGP